MTIDDIQEPTPEEQLALAALPREQEAGELLEERIVSALKKRRLLGPVTKPEHTTFRLLAVAAVSALLFVSGVVVGQWTGTRAVADSFANAQQQTVLEAATQIQRSGSAYVNALTAFAAVASTKEDPNFAQGREVALTALYAAAQELVMIAPEDPVALLLRARLAQLEAAGRGTDESAVQRVIWF